MTAVMPHFNKEENLIENCNATITNQNGSSSQVTKRTATENDPLIECKMNGTNPPCKISHNSVLGRHLVTTRDIKAGDVILQEAPLVTGPPPNQPPCCVSCYKKLTPVTRKECYKGCGWPVCSDLCADDERHVPECDITRNIRGEKVVIDKWEEPSQLFNSLIVLRCLSYRASNPSAWAKLSALESHCGRRKETGKYETERVLVAQFLRAFFKLESPFTEEDILMICGVIQVNGYGVRITDPSYIAVYDTLSFIEHHCSPNCAKSWSKTGVLTVHACADVPSNEHLSISYTEPLWGTVARRRHLKQELLSCRCSRCEDPTEFHTNYSAIRCTMNNCDGYLLPEEPLTDEPDNTQTDHAGSSRWLCSKCAISKTSQEVTAILEQVQNKMAVIDKTDSKALIDLLEDAQNVLHKNHFHLTDIRLNLSQLIGQDERSLRNISDQDLHHKMELCMDVLSLAEILFKGVPRVTGVMRYELHRCLMEDARRKVKGSKLQDTVIAKQISNARVLLAEAVSLLSYEPDILPEGQVALRAKEQLQLEDLHTTFQDMTLASVDVQLTSI